MHEASIAQHIIDQLTERMKLGSLPEKIEKINLKVGKMTAVVPENLIFMFGVLNTETLLDNVQLTITEIPVQCRCNICNSEFEVENIVFLCPKCNSPEVTIIAGRELLIDSVEVADADENN